MERGVKEKGEEMRDKKEEGYDNFMNEMVTNTTFDFYSM